MTNEQREMIVALRKQGYGYQKIANAIGCSKNTVSSYCRRLDLEASKAPERVCLLCGKTIPEHSRNTRKFCSDRCRKKWNNSRVHSELPYVGFCAACGKEMHMARKDEKRYCSHTCYIEGRFGGERHD